MEQVFYRGWKIRTISVVEGREFEAAALLERLGTDSRERRRYTFSRLSRHHSHVDAEFQALSWAKRWVESREAPKIGPA
jgi:hypothetical protein